MIQIHTVYQYHFTFCKINFFFVFKLKPVERLALRFVESTNSYQVEDEVEETEKMLEEKKKEWELNHLQSLKEAEERKNAEEEDDMLYTYVRDESYDQVNKSEKNKKRRTRKGSSKTSAAANSSLIGLQVENTEQAPGNKGLHVDIQPLLKKLGDKKIEEIKKTAQKTIQAKNDITKSTGFRKGRSVNNNVKAPASSNHQTVNHNNNKKAVASESTSLLSKQKAGPAANSEQTLISAAKLKAFKSCIEQHKSDKRPQRTLRNNTTSSSSDKPVSSTKARTPITLRDFISNKSSSLAQKGVSSPTPREPSQRTSTKTYTQTTLKPTPISSGASSPGSVDSTDSGDIRRSSRTPRPKVMNDEWVV